MANPIRDLVALTKPRVNGLVLVTFFGGLALGPGHLDPWRIAVAAIGTALTVGGAGALNQVIERDADARMRRTRGRPLPAGRLSPRVGAIAGVALGVAGVPVIAFATNALTAALAALALVSYVLVYTPLKRRTPAAILVGGVPGAIPPLMGWAAASGRVEAGALALFGLLYCWQIPHFLAIALYAADDYAAAGMRTLPNVAGPETTWRCIVGGSIVLFAASLAPVPLGVAGRAYLVVAIVAGALFVGGALAGLRAADRRASARALFVASLAHLSALFVVLAIGARRA